MMQGRHLGRRRQTLPSLIRFFFLVIFFQFLSSTLLQPPPHTTTTTTDWWSLLPVAEAWEWTDWVSSSSSSVSGGESTTTTTFLTKEEISNLRVRDLKRRLARTHGYSADELARMLDKKELIQALWGEEDREHQKAVDKIRRQVLWKGVWASIVAVVVVVGWPLWRHVYDVGLVNFEVYGDRKRLEIQKCIQYKTLAGSMGVLLMILVDLIQFWLSATVLLSWVMTSKYFFPIPSLAIRPGQFMGEKVAKGPMGRYGMNVAPMAISWAIRFTRGQVETWTARALSSAYQKEKKEARANESEEEKAARKAARKAAKRAAKEEARLQEEERLQKETLRRKEMAEQATSKLFGRGQQQQQPQEPKPEWQQERKNPFPDDHHNDDDDDDVPVDYDEEPDTRREFEEDLKDVDINDLD